jgi:hypothetical protein
LAGFILSSAIVPDFFAVDPAIKLFGVYHANVHFAIPSTGTFFR